MKNLDYMILVMRSYKEGKKIECHNLVIPNSKWEECIVPIWDWHNYDYRVKKEPTYRPYKNAEEFLQVQKEHGMYIRDIVDGTYYVPTSVVSVGIDLTAEGKEIRIEWTELCKEFVWQDGTPCGVITEN